MRSVLVFAFLTLGVVCMKTHGDQSPRPLSYDDEWWKSGVFYQIYPRSFKDASGNGQGDLKGITSKLEHLKELGVTGAWLSPVFKSPMKDGGYDIASFTEINDLFGNNDDMIELFEKAKELGLKIILDFVPNHTSDQHEWFMKSVRKEPGFENFYVWQPCPEREGGTGIDDRIWPNNWIAVFHTRAWTYNIDRDECYLHQFLAAQPDLNYRYPRVKEEMEKVFLYWLERGVDGFRIDAINHMFETVGLPGEPYIDEEGDKMLYDNLDHIHTRDLFESYETIYDWRKLMEDFSTQHGTTKKLMMTEAYASLENTLRWFGTESRPGSHMPFNFMLISDLNRDSTSEDFKKAIDDWLDNKPAFGEANWVLGNHDRSRIGYRYGEDRHESLAILTMLLPGINVVYYGEEILMTDNRAITFGETDDPQACQTNETVFQQYTRDPVRTPFQWDDSPQAGFSTAEKTWLPVHQNYETRNLKAQMEAERSTFKLYKHLIQLRKEEIFRNGDFVSKAITPTLFGYIRTLEGHDTVLVYVNLGLNTIINIEDSLPDNLIPMRVRAKVLAVSNDSRFRTGTYIPNPRWFDLGRHHAIVIALEEGPEETTGLPTTTTDGSSHVVASLVLIVASVMVNYL